MMLAGWTYRGEISLWESTLLPIVLGLRQKGRHLRGTAFYDYLSGASNLEILSHTREHPHRNGFAR